MIRSPRWSCLLCVLVLAGCAASAPQPQPAAGAHPPLLLISIDAYRADYLQRGMTPTLAHMAADGVRAQALQPAFPTLTFPNHYTLVTGLYPDHHGIVANNMYDAALGTFSLGNRAAVGDGRWWADAEPIWVSADKQGLQTATMFWPGSEAKIHGYRPDHWLPYDGTVTPDQRVDQVLHWLDLPGARRPDFLTLYFDDVDTAGHRFGPDSPQVDAALRKVDAAMARLVAGLKARSLYDRMNIIVVSDHGMAVTPKDQVVLMDKLIDLAHVRVVSMGVLAGFAPKSGYAAAVAARLLQPHPHMTCWNKADIPKRLHYGSHPRIPPLVCLADVGWQISSSDYVAHHEMALGEHGYDNASASMRALFIAHGPAFRRGLVVPEFPNVDIYPLMTHLLRIRPSANDGDYDAVVGMLRPRAR
jgi:predicted AlkP superfamily pyrophosphatase or phosphodiesterase